MKINRLSSEQSPYLLRGADGPVDWHPWGPEAFEKAKAEDKPIFLSVGYSACHWCHRMEREEFQDEEIATLLNRDFIPVKVDREERPDLEKVYLAAVQLISGEAGWPLSIFLTPDGHPFFGGTFFPFESTKSRPSFRKTLETVAETFREKRDRLNLSSDIIAQQVQGVSYPTPSPGPLDRGLIESGLLALADRFDDRQGGLRGTPKFPPSAVLGFLFRSLHRTADSSILHRIQTTLDGMARGGIYDQLAGGFHRYSSDARWLTPSFEKMLADNVFLIPVYLDAFLLTGVRSFVRTATETTQYVLRELRSPEGGFYASQDAETRDQEGRHYLWSYEEILEVLGEEEGALFADLFGVTAPGNFAEGLNVLYRTSGMGGLARRAELHLEEFLAKLVRWREVLLERRNAREKPPVDDKIVTAWNGLTITALARAAQVTHDPACLKAAEECARFVLENLKDSEGMLFRYFRKGPSSQRGFLEDYSYLAAGLLDLYETDFNPEWLIESRNLIDRMSDLFWDDTNGGFYFTAEKDLIARPKEFEDGATPSANAVATFTLMRLGVLLDSNSYLKKAHATLEAARGLVMKVPAALPGMLSALDFYISPTKEIAVAGRPRDAETRALLEKVWERYLPNRVIALADPDETPPCKSPLLEHKPLVDGKPAAYVCRDYKCDTPITNPDTLAEALSVSDDTPDEET